MKFLIVDDSRAMQVIVQRLLEKAGYSDVEFKSASSGMEALEIMTRWHPDLVITDWHMPGMSGLELLQTLNQLGNKGTKVGFVTTETGPKQVEQAMQNGASFVVHKPCKEEELRQAVISTLQNATDCEESVSESAGTASGSKLRLPDSDEFKHLLATHVSPRLLLTAVPPVPLERARLPFVLGAFASQNSKAVRAICLLDLDAACILGGTMAGLDNKEVKRAIAAKTVNKNMFDHCNALLQQVGIYIKSTSGSGLVLTSQHLVPKPFERLYSLSNTSYARQDFEIAIAGQGHGVVTLLLS